jgi:hypothetical protein
VLIPLIIDAKIMVKSLASLTLLSAVFGILGHSTAREALASDVGMSHDMSHSPALYPDMGFNSPFAPSLPIGNHFGSSPYPPSSVYSGMQNYGSLTGSSFPFPRMLLPLPINSRMWGFQTHYGFQYPGSYLPPGTPLHRYNGYIVCDPPPAAAGKRIVKITSTRSLAAPGDTQPCPVYTIDGEAPRGKSYTTTNTAPAIRSSPPR